MNEQDALKLMQKVVDKVLPSILNQSFKNFKTGSITGVTNGITAEVLMDNGVKVSGISIPKGVTPFVGDKCLIVTINSNNSGSNYIVAIY